MTGKSGRGTARQTIRVDEELWGHFGTACEAAGLDRSAAVRAFMAWFARQPNAKMPKRPDTAGEASALGRNPGDDSPREN